MEPLSGFLLVLLVVAALFVLVLVLKTLFTVRTATAGVVERFGKFNRIVRPGLHVLVPFAESVYFVDLQVKQAQFSVETKTRDNVFVQIPVSVQYVVAGMNGRRSQSGWATCRLRWIFSMRRCGRARSRCRN